MNVLIFVAGYILTKFWGAGVGMALAERLRFNKEYPGFPEFAQSYHNMEKNIITRKKREARLRGEHIVP